MIPLILKKLVPLPRILQMRNVVFVGPHPDDIEIGAGGTAHRLVAAGARVTFVICTDGGCGSTDPSMTPEKLSAIRTAEAKAAAERIGVSGVRFLGFPDGGTYSEWDLALRLAGVIAEIRPDMVFGPDPNLPSECHPDHLRTAQAVRTAVFLTAVPNVLTRNGIPFDQDLYYRTSSPSLAYFYTHRPNRRIGLGKSDVEAKNAAILCHKSQFPLESVEWKNLSAYLRLRQTGLGLPIFRSQAEAFFTLSPAHQHCFPEVLKF